MTGDPLGDALAWSIGATTGKHPDDIKVPRRRPRGRRTPYLSAYDLYEICVTAPGPMTRFLDAVHGHAPKVLREDFCGTGALARAWADRSPRARSIAVDCDAFQILTFTLNHPGWKRVRTITSDAARCRERADIIAATNFPIGYWHDRAALLRYLRVVRASLNPRGVFVCDTYGGRDAFSILSLKRRVRGPHAERIEQEWEQREADPATGMVTDVLHFRVREPGSRRARVLRDAFVYRWRLWSIPELRDAMLEAGFRAVEVYDRLGGALDHKGRLHARPLAPGEPLDENYVVYLAARR